MLETKMMTIPKATTNMAELTITLKGNNPP
jgi:hypothetical protein